MAQELRIRGWMMAATLVLAACSEAEAPKQSGFEYPKTAKVDIVDDYHGTEVADPYRWLEDDIRENADVSTWVDAQNEITQAYLEDIDGRDVLKARITDLINYERYGTPELYGTNLFYTRNDGLQDQSVLYVVTNDGEPRVLIDPNGWSEDGTVALAGFIPSADGTLLAYAVQDGGSDWRTWRVMNVATGEDTGDELTWLKFTGVSWAKDGSGFYYSRYPRPAKGEELQSLNTNMKVFFHRLGTSESEDQLVHEAPENPEWGFFSEVSDDDRYLVITTWVGTDDRYRLTIMDRQTGEKTALVDVFENSYSYITNEGSRFTFQTNKGAAKNRVVAIDLANPAPDAWTELIAEDRNLLDSTRQVGDRLVAEYLKDAKSALVSFALDGGDRREIELPGIGSVGGINGTASSDVLHYSFSSYATPPSIYRYSIASGEQSLFKRADTGIDPDDYVVEQIFFSSKDGTRLPMFVAHKKALEPNGELPTLLYGYGGFNISLTPSYSTRWISWMELGGVVGIVNLRGGGEYGEPWHKAGTKLQKQNVFDDFIAAGEYLIRANYTSSDRLAVMGGSNGGLLVGAVVNQRPDLFGAALPMVGVMDMLRFHKFTAGRFWTDDYGSSDNPEEFEALYAYSPYHNLKSGTDYPPILVTTADRDDRVVPGHSFKYAARLQEVQSGEAPVLIRVETRAGHGAGSSTSQTIELMTDQFSFLAKAMGMQLVRPDS